MSKRSSRPRSASPTRYGRATAQMPVQQAAPSAESKETAPARQTARASGMTRAQAAAVNFAEEYAYVYRDLRRMAILAGAIIVILIVLSFII